MKSIKSVLASAHLQLELSHLSFQMSPALRADHRHGQQGRSGQRLGIELEVHLLADFHFWFWLVFELQLFDCLGGCEAVETEGVEGVLDYVEVAGRGSPQLV